MWRDPASALHRSIHGTAFALWTAEIELLAGVHDHVALANWQRTGKKRGKPKPLKRPRDKSVKSLWTGTPTTLDDLDALIGWESPRSRK